jgi:hypothetical protein
MRHVLLGRAGVLAAAIVASSLSVAVARDTTMPPMKAADLNGRALDLPRDMSGDPSVWVVAFDRVHQSQVDRLFGLLDTAKPTMPGLVYWEVPVIENPGAIGRWFIDNGMRSGIPKKDVRARVVTLYVPDRALWLKQVGVAGPEQAYAVLVGREGQILSVAAQSDIKTASDMTAFLGKAGAPPGKAQ